MVGSIAIYACALLLIITAAVHSVLGEIRLITPLLAQRGGVLDSELARFLLRFVWHAMSMLFAIVAITLIVAAASPGNIRTSMLACTAVGVGGSGIYDAIATKGRHIGWPLLVAIGVAATVALAAA